MHEVGWCPGEALSRVLEAVYQANAASAQSSFFARSSARGW